MASVTLSPTIVESEASLAGVQHWVFPNNALTQDDSYAAAGIDSHWLRLYGYDVSSHISAEATINGIVFEAEGRGDSTSLGHVHLRIGGSYVGENKGPLDLGMVDTDTYVSVGGPSDLWGLTPSAEDLRDPGFSIGLRTHTLALDVVEIDHTRLTIYYSDIKGPSRVWKGQRAHTGITGQRAHTGIATGQSGRDAIWIGQGVN